MLSRFLLLIATLFALGQVAHAQEGAKPTGESAAAPDHSQADHSQMGLGAAASPPAPTTGDSGKMGGSEHGAVQGGKAPPDARDPHAYAEGYGFGPMRPDMGDDDYFGQFLVNSAAPPISPVPPATTPVKRCTLWVCVSGFNAAAILP